MIWMDIIMKGLLIHLYFAYLPGVEHGTDYRVQTVSSGRLDAPPSYSSNVYENPSMIKKGSVKVDELASVHIKK